MTSLTASTLALARRRYSFVFARQFAPAVSVPLPWDTSRLWDEKGDPDTNVFSKDPFVKLTAGWCMQAQLRLQRRPHPMGQNMLSRLFLVHVLSRSGWPWEVGIWFEADPEDPVSGPKHCSRVARVYHIAAIGQPRQPRV